MKIAWVSSWPPRPCGIATYSSELVHALRSAGNEVHIICHTDGGTPGEENVHPVIDTQHAGWDEEVHRAVKEISPEVVHIQHEYGLYATMGDHAASLFRPLFRWKVEEKFPVVVTYHSVYTRLNKMMRYYMDVMQNLVDGGTVFEPYQWAYLAVNIGRVVDNVYVIPHGAKGATHASKEDSRKSLNLQGKKVVGLLGWFTETKGFHRVIERWDSISKKLGPDTVLVLAGDARLVDPGQQEYKRKLLSLINNSEFKDRIRLVLGSFTPEEYENVLASFDVMVMPYSFASQSGNLAHSLSLGVPVVASALEGLKSVIDESGAGIGVPTDDADELERAIVAVMQDDSLREKLSTRAAAYVKSKISWPVIVEKHMRLYRKLMDKKQMAETDVKPEALLEA